MTAKTEKLEFRCNTGLKKAIQCLATKEQTTTSKYLEKLVSEKAMQLLLDDLFVDTQPDKKPDIPTATTTAKKSVNLSDEQPRIDDSKLSFRITTNHPQIARIQFELGERVLDMVNQGIKHREIAAVWNDEGLRTFDNRVWNRDKVKNFLQTIRSNLKK